MGIAPYFNEPVPFPGYLTGNYYQPDISLLNVQTANAATGSLFFTPFVPKDNHTFTGVAVYNKGTADSGKKCRLGIYEDDGTGQPGDLLLDAGELTFTGTAGLFVITISQALTADTLYWLASTTDSTISFSCLYLGDDIGVTGSAIQSPPRLPAYGFQDYVTSNIFQLIAQTFTYGTLPSSAGTISLTSANQPIVFMEA